MSWYNIKFTNLSRCYKCGWLLMGGFDPCPCIKAENDKHPPFQNKHENEMIARIDTKDLIDEAMLVLSTYYPSEEIALRMRYGIGERRDHTYAEIAYELNVTKARARQIEHTAMRRVEQIINKKLDKLKEIDMEEIDMEEIDTKKTISGGQIKLVKIMKNRPHFQIITDVIVGVDNAMTEWDRISDFKRVKVPGDNQAKVTMIQLTEWDFRDLKMSTQYGRISFYGWLKKEKERIVKDRARSAEIRMSAEKVERLDDKEADYQYALFVNQVA